MINQIGQRAQGNYWNVLVYSEAEMTNRMGQCAQENNWKHSLTQTEVEMINQLGQHAQGNY
jgi:hypothetical protein